MEKFNKIKYNNEYNKNAYDRITLLLPKGYKERLKQQARANNLTYTGYIRMCIDNQLAKDRSESE